MENSKTKISLAIIAATSVMLTACSNDPVPQDVAINFAAQVNGEDFTCANQPYAGIGNPIHDMNITDFRMYIHGAHIHDEATGNVYPIELTQDGVWQLDDLALLDFEDAAGVCSASGTPQTNTSLKGKVTVPATVDLAAAEVCFEVGVPEDKNYLDVATAASPLNASGLFWAWKTGHKYIRIDGIGDPAGAAQGFNLHLGAQGCPGASPTAPPDSACTVPNTFEVCVANFDVDNSVIVVDPAYVFEANDVTVNQSALGCMSFVGDSDCDEIMPRLGLDYSYGGTANASTYTAGQKLFSKQ